MSEQNVEMKKEVEEAGGDCGLIFTVGLVVVAATAFITWMLTDTFCVNKAERRADDLEYDLRRAKSDYEWRVTAEADEKHACEIKLQKLEERAEQHCFQQVCDQDIDAWKYTASQWRRESASCKIQLAKCQGGR